MVEPASPKVAYQAAHTAAIVVDRSNLGLLNFTGETRLDLIHRMSTQALNHLASGEGAATILTTDIGRMLDRLLLYVGDDAVYALTGEGNAGAIARYLLRFVFFNDDFHLEDLSEETAVLAVYGPAASQKLRPLFGEAVEIPLHHWRQRPLNELSVSLHRTDPLAGGGYFVIGDATAKETISQALLNAGITPAGPDVFDYVRIESGLPRFGREITQEYIPLEANLWADVSFSKGCYTGQEVIARMESRGRLAKQLAQLHPEAPVNAGMAIEAGGRAVGTVTSAATGPAGPVALGYIKTRALDDGPATFTAGEVALHPQPLAPEATGRRPNPAPSESR